MDLREGDIARDITFSPHIVTPVAMLVISGCRRALNPDSRFQLVNAAEWDGAEALDAATAQDFFKQSTHRSMHDFAVAAHPAIYRVVIEAAAE